MLFRSHLATIRRGARRSLLATLTATLGRSRRATFGRRAHLATFGLGLWGLDRGRRRCGSFGRLITRERRRDLGTVQTDRQIPTQVHWLAAVGEEDSSVRGGVVLVGVVKGQDHADGALWGLEGEVPGLLEGQTSDRLGRLVVDLPALPLGGGGKTWTTNGPWLVAQAKVPLIVMASA